MNPILAELSRLTPLLIGLGRASKLLDRGGLFIILASLVVSTVLDSFLLL